MAEQVDANLTASGVAGIKAGVENAIQAVLGNDGSADMRISSRGDDIVSRELLITKIEDLSEGIKNVAQQIANLGTTQSESAQQLATVATENEEGGKVWNRMANTLDEIYSFLQEKFKNGGLSGFTADSDVGNIEKQDDKTSNKITEKDKKEIKEDAVTSIPLIAPLLAGGIVVAIKDWLGVTWKTLTDGVMTSITAFQAFIRGAIGRVGKIFKGFKISDTAKFAKNWPKLTKLINGLLSPFRLLGKGMRQLQLAFTNVQRAFTNAVRLVKSPFTTLQKILNPITKGFKAVSKVVSSITAGFGGMSPIVKSTGKLFGTIGKLLGKLAVPITLAMESFDLVSMIFKGEFSKNAKKISDQLSEKGVFGRALYSVMNMFSTIATFGWEFWETLKSMTEMFRSDNPEGFWGMIKDAFSVAGEFISELFYDNVIYPIAKALSWVGITDDPDDIAAKEQAEKDEVSAAAAVRRQKEDQVIKDKAKQFGITEEDYRAYRQYKNSAPEGGVLGIRDWIDKGGNLNKSPEGDSIPPLLRAPSSNSTPQMGPVQNTIIQKAQTFNYITPESAAGSFRPQLGGAMQQ